jgi:predicted nucleic acid-binding protein
MYNPEDTGNFPAFALSSSEEDCDQRPYLALPLHLSISLWTSEEKFQAERKIEQDSRTYSI